ncbi:hypothetical protein GAC87_08745, partial [Bacteroides thetaiotaomicron]
LSANSVMRGRLDARRTLKSLVADLRLNTKIYYPKLLSCLVCRYGFILKKLRTIYSLNFINKTLLC